MTPEQQRRVANVAANLFLPLEKRLGFFKPEDGADKAEVLAWWAELLGDYAPADLLWFAEYWLRTDEWGKFPRSPALVQKIMRQNERAPVSYALPAPPDEWEIERVEFRAWHAENVKKHHASREWWHRRALEWTVDEMIQAHATATGLTVEMAALALWRAGDLPEKAEADLPGKYAEFVARCEEWESSRSEITRGIARLWRSHWADEKRAWQSVYDAAHPERALPEKHTG